MHYTKESLIFYIKKKGIRYFINNPSESTKQAFEGVIYRNGIPNLALLYSAINK